MILPQPRDPRYITVRRGGTLSDADHQLLALWAVECAEHVLPLFEAAEPGDSRPSKALAACRAWVRGEINMLTSRAAGGHSMGAARDLSGGARFAAYSAGQAACVPHVAAHDLGAAAYALKAVAADAQFPEHAIKTERQWQRDQLPSPIRPLVLDSQQRRNDICWGLFD